MVFMAVGGWLGWFLGDCDGFLYAMIAFVVISHKEGHARGIAANHGDPEDLWKGLGLAYTMDSFRKAVKAAMSGKAEGTQASVFLGLSDEAAAEKIGVLCGRYEDQRDSGFGVCSAVYSGSRLWQDGAGAEGK